MKKDTLTFERKLYTAPVCKTHVLELDGTLLAGEGSGYGQIGGAGDEDPYAPGDGTDLD